MAVCFVVRVFNVSERFALCRLIQFKLNDYAVFVIPQFHDFVATLVCGYNVSRCNDGLDLQAREFNCKHNTKGVHQTTFMGPLCLIYLINGFMHKTHLTIHVRFEQCIYMPQGNVIINELSNTLAF